MRSLILILACSLISNIIQAQWTSLQEEDFSNPSFNTQLGGVSGFSAAGFQLNANFGTTGQMGDACASVTSFSFGNYIAFQYNLVAGETYHLKVAGRANSGGRAIKFTYGNSLPPYPRTLIQGGIYLNNLSVSQAATIHKSTTFTVPTSGIYWLAVERDNGLNGGFVQLDDFALEQSGGVSIPLVNFTATSLNMQPGSTSQVCLSISEAPTQNLTIPVSVGSNSSPHFTSFTSPTNLFFPAGSTAQQCFNLQASTDTLTIDSNYELNISGANAGSDDLLLLIVVGHQPAALPIASFSDDTLTIQSGNNINACVALDAAPSNNMDVALNLIGSAAPHLSNLSFPYTISFPAGSTTPQCLNLAMSSDIQPSDASYSLTISTATQGVLDTLIIIVPGVDTTNNNGGGPTTSPPPTPDELNVSLIARPLPGTNNIRLRWAPLDHESWEWGNYSGYRLYRITVAENGVSTTVNEQAQSNVMLDSTLQALPEADWETLIDNDEFYSLAAGALYGEGFMVDTIASGATNIFQAFNASQEKQNRFGFSLFAADQSFDVAQAMGLAFEDTNLDPNKIYLYRVRFNEVPSSVNHNFGSERAQLSNIEALPPPSSLLATPSDHAVQLNWDRGFLDDYYTSYDVFRSEDNGQTFEQANDLPIIYTNSDGPESEFMFYADSLEQNGTNYQYKIRGNTPFDIPGPFSEIVEVMGIAPPLGIEPYIRKVWEHTAGSMEVVWEFPPEHNGDLSHFDILRSKIHDGTFEKINSSPVSVVARAYQDNTALAVAYYKVAAVDENDYEVASVSRLAQLDDEVPPAVPTILECTADDEGIAQIKWLNNTEEDLMGYRVYMCNQSNGEYTQLTSIVIKDTLFYEQFNLNTLSEEVYLKVSALDFRENQSEQSDYCTLQLPDVVAPSAPNFVSLNAELGKVIAEWDGSSSKDIVSHQLERKTATGEMWETIWSGEVNGRMTFEDTTAQYDMNYHYRVGAVDDAGLLSYSKTLQSRPLDDGVREEFKNVWGIAFIPGTLGSGGGIQAIPSTRGIIGLVWEYSNHPNLHSFLVYRSVREEEMRPYKTVYPQDVLVDQQTLQDKMDQYPGISSYSNNYTPSCEIFYFEDPGLKRGQAYKYKVVARYVDGGASPMSESVTIMY